jgi:hypothetical protein
MGPKMPRRARPVATNAIETIIKSASVPSDLDELDAELELTTGLRALGPVPAALRRDPNPDAVPETLFEELVAALDDLADRADEPTRRLAWRVRSQVRPRRDAPNPTAIAVVVAGFASWGNMDDPDVGASSVAGSLDLPAAYVARWGLRYARLHSRRLRRLDPTRHAAFITALEVSRETLVTGACGIRLFPDSTAPSIEQLLA